ncbi:MAG: ATP-grasp domain-containing protein [Planctomycetota bacterium]|jgi:carbamoyl-phosphate synthase large subunit
MTRSSGNSKRKRTNKPARGKRVSSSPELRVLFSCAGRRVGLIETFRQAGERLGITLKLHGADLSASAPAMHCVDRAHLVPRVLSEDYVPELLRICRRNRIDMLVPLLDPELPALAAAREAFAESGCRVLISDRALVDTCRDKLATFKALGEAGIDAPKTWTLDQVAQRKRHRFPYFLKPRFGSAAVGNHIVKSADELDFHGSRVKEAIVQELLVGPEYTTDVYCGLDGQPRCAVPRRRLEVRNGEVSKGVTVRHPEIMATAMRVTEALGGCRGVVTVQCMHHREERVCVLEINPRFGGGVPLAIRAGADFPRWLMMEVLGRRPRIGARPFKEDMAMLRFDEAVYVDRAARKGITAD